MQLTPKLTATVAPTGTAIQVAPDAATYEVSANHAASEDDALFPHGHIIGGVNRGYQR
jgi:hypothetical protein